MRIYHETKTASHGKILRSLYICSFPPSFLCPSSQVSHSLLISLPLKTVQLSVQTKQNAFTFISPAGVSGCLDRTRHEKHSGSRNRRRPSSRSSPSRNVASIRTSRVGSISMVSGSSHDIRNRASQAPTRSRRRRCRPIRNVTGICAGCISSIGLVSTTSHHDHASASPRCSSSISGRRSSSCGRSRCRSCERFLRGRTSSSTIHQ